MRPHKLELSNFGPFLKAKVDFDDIGDEVYMIVGDTGAGKTLIFDAVSYALFGRASGDKRSNVSLETLYCRYVEKDENGKRPDMKIELSFTEKGQDYRVERILKWGQTGKAVNAGIASHLYKNGDPEPIASDVRNDIGIKNEVTAKIVSMLGLNADDFKKIVMLAQGEFQQFLEAKGKDRNAIIGRLYDNSRHIDLQKRLIAAKALLDDKKRTEYEKMDQALKDCPLPEDLPENDRERLDLLAEDPDDLFEALENLKKLLKEEYDRTVGEKKQKETALSGLHGEIAKAEQTERMLDKLEDLRKEKGAHDAEAAKYDELKEKVKRLSEAEKVMPLRKAYEAAEIKLEAVRKSGKALAAKLDGYKTDEPKLSERKEEQKIKTDAKTAEINEYLTLLNSRRPLYEKLEETVLKEKKNKTDLEGLKEELKRAGEALDAGLKEEKSLDDLLKNLEDAGEASVKRAEDLKKSIENRVLELNDLEKRVKTALETEKAVSAAAKKFDEAAGKTAELQLSFDTKNALLRSGRAGFLSKALKEEIEKNGSAPCPVCNTVHTAAHVHMFASMPDNVPDEKEVDALYEKLKASRRIDEGAQKEFNDIRNIFEGEKKLAAENAKRLLELYDWEEIAKLDRIREAMGDAAQDLEKAVKDLKAAVTDRDKKAAASRRREELLKEKDKLQIEKERSEKEVNNLETQKVLIGNDLKDIKEQLKGFPATKEEADKDEKSRKEELKAVTKAYEDLIKEYNDLRDLIKGAEGEASQNAEHERTQITETENLKAEYEKGLSDQGFENEASYANALSPEGAELRSINEVRKWLEEKTGELSNYDKKTESLKARISEQEENTKGLERIDTKALHIRQDELNKAGAELDRKIQKQFADNKKAEECIDRIRLGMDNIRRFKRMSDKLDPMVTNTASSKYSFKDFVLGDFFGRIVNHASHYFMELMDGRYSLVTERREVKTKNKDNEELRDFEIVVLDEQGNQSPVSLLSGGQSFEASLALALGLSEVVQMRKAGKVHIESMFIDEGFGTLDGHRLERSMHVLNGMTEQNRQIGIITHVEKLVNAEQYKKLEVVQTEGISTVTYSNNR